MGSRRILWVGLELLLTISLVSCEEVTIPGPEPASSPADHVVINEIFTLPPDKYYAHRWIEIFNPLSEDINLYGWSLVFQNAQITFRFQKQEGDTTFYLQGGFFFVLTDSEEKFWDFWRLAPRSTLIKAPVLKALGQTDEIRLLDREGNPVDVVRFGNYTPPEPDPFPENKSFGMVPEWHSICRYADRPGAYDTDNSADDFFDEDNPVPGWYSQRFHP